MLRLPVRINRKTIALLLLVLVAEGIAVGFIYARVAMSLSTLNQELSDKKQKLQQASALSKTLPAQQALLLREQTRLSHLEMSLSTKEYIPTLLLQLEGLAHQTFNKINSIRPVAQPAVKPATPGAAAGGTTGGQAAQAPSTTQPSSTTSSSTTGATPAAPAPDPGASYDKYQVTLNIQGTYTNVMSFLMKLTTFPKIISVDQFQVHTIAPGAAGGADLVGVDLTFTAYVLKGS